ncbi:hypothetical protein HNV08_12210 [Winogradskyella eckloniae]|uniref:hypothetical protein n=1 Tax=Winogradskyella eckloniae TaxID=1089306 RepID=UPI001563DA34|nr:hypothetical protein [Winogradskyella eckloniae]NRD20811.1 hypothetical protein [Winogradskyella eckloniae]
MTVREATQLDFEGIYGLLARLNSTSFSKSDWQKIVSVNFNAEHTHYGYVLEVENKILGFIGTIFTERIINGEMHRFCNFHSWIVDPSVKTGGMALLLKVLKLKDHVVTNFTASEVPYKIFKSLKFREIEYKNYKLLPLQSHKSRSKIKIYNINDQNAGQLLGQEELKLYNDHKIFENTQFLYLKQDDLYSFVICKKRSYVPNVFNKISILKSALKDILALSEIHYISHPEVFFNGFSNTGNAVNICRKLGWSMGVLVADRYIPKNCVVKKKYYPSKRPYVYRYADNDELIDTLYSEFFILNF